MTIPKILHTVWFDLGGNPTAPVAKYRDMMQSRATFMDPSAWRHIEWSRPMADQFLQEHYPWFLPYWNSYKDAIYNIDAIRYFVLYHYGGVYLDQDILLHRPIDEMLVGRSVILGNTSTLGLRITNFMMATEAGHPFFLYLIHRLIKSHGSLLHLSKSFTGAMFTAGPLFLQNGYLEWINGTFSWSNIPSPTTVPFGDTPSASTSPSPSPSLSDSVGKATESGITVLPVWAWLPGKGRPNILHRDYRYGEHVYAKSWGVSSKITWDAARFVTILGAVGLMVFAATSHQKTTCLALSVAP